MAGTTETKEGSGTPKVSKLRSYVVMFVGSDQPVGGEPGETPGGAVQATLLHGLPPVLGATEPEGEMM